MRKSLTPKPGAKPHVIFTVLTIFMHFATNPWPSQLIHFFVLNNTIIIALQCNKALRCTTQTLSTLSYLLSV